MWVYLPGVVVWNVGLPTGVVVWNVGLPTRCGSLECGSTYPVW